MTEKILERYLTIRNASVAICENLSPEDHSVQPHSVVSPPKWHLAHTSWFFEELILAQFVPSYVRYDENFRVLFNSYYKAAGKHWIQADRGILSRPTTAQVSEYREVIDKAIHIFLTTQFSALSEKNQKEVIFLLQVGLHHEQQHQELLLSDIKYILGTNYVPPVYREISQTLDVPLPSSTWTYLEEGLYEIGYQGNAFSYDNERPAHKHYIYETEIRDSLVTNKEYLEFINDAGYFKPEHWLSQGWDWIHDENISCPLYWRLIDDNWFEFTLHGLKPLEMNSPVTHLSYFEADAFANYTGYRLPTEQELEIFLQRKGSNSLSLKSPATLHPQNANAISGQVWCWTRSHYSPYPKYREFEGLLREYNGKFMCNQFVLRGGSIATPENHYRPTYRNFLQPEQRWLFTGMRLARDI